MSVNKQTEFEMQQVGQTVCQYDDVAQKNASGVRINPQLTVALFCIKD